MSPTKRRLLPIDPIGIDTIEVESLSSFVIRLADAHGVSPWHLIERLCKDHGQPGLAASYRSASPAYLVRPTQDNRVLAQMLSESCDLPISTFDRITYLSLDGVLNRHQGSFESNLRWCPRCLGEAEQTATEWYLRLSWSLSAIATCPFHRVPLQSHCPVCAAKQDTWRRNDSGGHCIKCGASLSGTPENTPIANSWELDYADLLDLTAFIATGGYSEFRTDGPRVALQTSFDEAWDRGDELNYYKKLPRDEYLAFLHHQKPITLNTARRLALRTGIPLVDMLCGIAKETTRELRPEWLERLPGSLAPARRPEKLDLLRVTEAVNTIERTGIPLSLRSIAKRVGVSVGGLAHHFPETTDRIVSRYKASLATTKKRKEQEAKTLVDRSILEWPLHHGGAPSKKGLLKILFPSSGLPKNLLREVINSAFDAES